MDKKTAESLDRWIQREDPRTKLNDELEQCASDMLCCICGLELDAPEEEVKAKECTHLCHTFAA